MNPKNIEADLMSEIRLSKIQAQVFILIVIEGKMSPDKISKKLHISIEDANHAVKYLMDLGGIIDMPKSEFESMHPRFSAVNMYRKMCEKNNIEFKRNMIVDNIGVALEEPYDNARTKYNNQ